MFVQPLGGWRHVKVTDRRTAWDFAHDLKDLVDRHVPQATLSSVVLDNLNTHTPAALYETLAPAEARRLLQKLDVRDTPQARELAQYGGNRVRGAVNAVFEPPHLGPSDGPSSH
jgi:hypothetical protein